MNYDAGRDVRGGVPRFTQPDTIVPDASNPQDLNRYTYVRGNPATFNDPSGHCIEANSFSFNEETGYIHYTPMRGPECSGAESRFPATGELGGIPGTTAQLGATEDSLAWVHYEPSPNTNASPKASAW